MTHPRPICTLAASHASTMLSQGPRPLNNSISSQVSPHPQEVARVLNTITEIMAASAEIIRRDEVYPICSRQLSLNTYQFVNVVPTLERKVTFTYHHVGQSIRTLKISMGRGYVASSIYYPATSQAFNDMHVNCKWICSTTYHRTYCLLSILVDIQHILSSSDPIEISDDTINRRLDDFLFHFQV